MNSSAKNLFGLLEDLLTWSRSQTGKIQYLPEQQDLSSIVKNTLDVLSPAAEAKGIELSSGIPEGTLIYADANMLNLVIRNLVSNSIKFTSKGGTVHIFSRTEEKSEIVSVIDSGIGMSEEDQNKLFRLDIAVTTIGTNKEKGTGLGLILCKDFVERNGGEISVESKPGKGSTFRFSVPKNRP